MTGSKHNLEGNSSDRGEPDPGPYWRRMHRDWRFWVGALFMFRMAASFLELQSTRWHKGEEWLLHAETGACEFHPDNAVTLLEIALPESS
jgi:hypothetical protein